MSDDPCQYLQQEFLQATHELQEKQNRMVDIINKGIRENGASIKNDNDEFGKLFEEVKRALLRYQKLGADVIECRNVFNSKQ